MPPYGLYSLANTPEELLSKGYGMVNTEFAEDPAFGNLTYNTAYNPAPYTGAMPFQNVFRISEGVSNNFDNPSYGGSSNINYNQFKPEEVATGIMKKASGFPLPEFDMANLPMYEKDDEQDQDYIDQVKKSQGGGIGGLFKFLLGLAVPGAGILMNLGQSGFDKLRGGFDRGLGSLRNLNQRLQQSDFGQSRTGAEYFMKRRERKQAERAQQAMPDVYRDARDQGFTNDRGGFSTNRADRAGTSVGSGQFSPKTSRGRSGY